MRHTRRQRHPGGEKGQVPKHANPDHETHQGNLTVEQYFLQTLSYETWKRTSFPVPKGSRKRSVIAAIIAQKKLTRGVNESRQSCQKRIPSPHDLGPCCFRKKRVFGCRSANLWGEEIRHLFQTEQNTANGSPKGDRNARGTCSAEYLASLA